MSNIVGSWVVAVFAAVLAAVALAMSLPAILSIPKSKIHKVRSVTRLRSSQSLAQSATRASKPAAGSTLNTLLLSEPAVEEDAPATSGTMDGLPGDVVELQPLELRPRRSSTRKDHTIPRSLRRSRSSSSANPKANRDSTLGAPPQSSTEQAPRALFAVLRRFEAVSEAFCLYHRAKRSKTYRLVHRIFFFGACFMLPVCLIVFSATSPEFTCSADFASSEDVVSCESDESVTAGDVFLHIWDTLGCFLPSVCLLIIWTMQRNAARAAAELREAEAKAKAAAADAPASFLALVPRLLQPRPDSASEDPVVLPAPIPSVPSAYALIPSTRCGTS